jgi:hypothetical protein
MPTRTNRRTGEVQELQPDGNWKTIVPPSASAPALSLQTKPANPAQPYIAPKAAADVRSVTAQTDKTVAETPLDIENKRLTNIKLKQEVAQGQGQLTPQAMAGIRRDSVTKINEIRRLRGRIEGTEFPNLTGAGLGGVLKIIPGTDARGIADSLKQIGSAGALATALQMAKNNGGRNPLQPMSNSDIDMISNITAALDQGQKYSDLKHQLDNAEAAFGHAFIGAGGKPDALYDKNRADGPFPGQRQQRRTPQRQPRVVDFNDLPE